MSRPVLEVTLRLDNGKVMTGRGRNLPATIERIYNHASGLDVKRRVTITEHLKTGHVKHGESRYRGTFHVKLAGTGDASTGGDILGTADVRESGTGESE